MRIKFILVFILFSIVSCSKESKFGTHGKWQNYGQNDIGDFNFDKTSVTKNGFKEILVWDYLMLSPGHTREIRKVIPELSNVAHMLGHVKIDYENNRYSQLRIIQYNREKKIVYDSEGKDMSPTSNRLIPENSAIEKLSQIVCKVDN